MTLTEFLLARIAEDEAAAEEAATYNTAEWHVESDGEYVVDRRGQEMCKGILTLTVTEHIARHDPARVLAQCAALRAVVANCSAHVRQWQTLCPDRTDWRDAAYAVSVMTLISLASTHADHPDYREEWAA